MKRVQIHIDRLTLDGFDGIDGQAVGRAIERELTRLVGRDATLRPGAIDRVDGGTLPLPAVPTPGQLGRAVSSSIHRSVRGVGKR